MIFVVVLIFDHNIWQDYISNSTEHNWKYSISGQFLQKHIFMCTRQRVDMFVLSWLMLFEWLALCVRVSVCMCGNSGKHAWDAQQPLHYSLLLQEPPYTHTHTNSGRPMLFFMANANILESRLADIKPMYISHYLI